jgi:hypothetical protein
MTSSSAEKSSKLKSTGVAMGGSAKSLGKVVGYWYKGMLIDMPLAVSEGLRAVPRLYGDEVKDHGTVRDWKSGASFAGKNFVHGMADGFSDIFTQPYKGGQEEGAKGVMKGLAKGTLGVTTKVSSGMCISLMNFMEKDILNDYGSCIGISGLSRPRNDEEPVYRDALPNKETHHSSANSGREVFVRTLLKGA